MIEGTVAEKTNNGYESVDFFPAICEAELNPIIHHLDINTTTPAEEGLKLHRGDIGGRGYRVCGESEEFESK